MGDKIKQLGSQSEKIHIDSLLF